MERRMPGVKDHRRRHCGQSASCGMGNTASGGAGRRGNRGSGARCTSSSEGGEAGVAQGGGPGGRRRYGEARIPLDNASTTEAAGT
jgi:hypothetical protein